MKKIRQICINAKFVIMYVEHPVIYGIMLNQYMRESNVQFVTNNFRQNNLWRSILQPGIQGISEQSVQSKSSVVRV